jgi:hypothetical protein
MPGVTIGDKVVVGANSLISKSIESNSLIAGSPAKVIKENYPPPITEEKVVEIFNQFVSDFLNHLSYHEVAFSRSESNGNSIINGNYKGKTFNFFINCNVDYKLENYMVDTLIITNIAQQSPNLAIKPDKNVMILDIFNKTRFGKSHIGEEFVKFVSRYGLRFSRLD